MATRQLDEIFSSNFYQLSVFSILLLRDSQEKKGLAINNHSV